MRAVRPADQRGLHCDRDVRDEPHARKAVGHLILVAAFHILASGVPYAELDGDYYPKPNSPERRARKHLNDLKALG